MTPDAAGETGRHPSLTPRAGERLRALLAPPAGTRGWARALVLRRVTALLLALLAAGLALRPAGAAEPPAPAAPSPPAPHHATMTGTPLAGDPNTAAVPVRLADPAVAALLHPGTEVDVVSSAGIGAAAGPGGDGGTVLAAGATVAAVRSTGDHGGDHGRLVVLRLPRKDATRVAAASLDGAVAVTLRGPS